MKENMWSTLTNVVEDL